MQRQVKDFILMLADNSMILGQRLGEWCGHGPVLEQDIAVTNISLDLIGEARNYYQYLAEIENGHEDDYPMKRDVREFKNVLLTEQPNGHWGDTLMRQCMFDCFHYYFLAELTKSTDQRLSAIAKKSLKEATYHLSYSGEWVIRLGDGTEESKNKMQKSLENLIRYFDEFFMSSDFETFCMDKGICPDMELVKTNAKEKFDSIIENATLSIPKDYYSHSGGKQGIHTEHLGFILTEMQYLQKSFPGVTW